MRYLTESRFQTGLESLRKDFQKGDRLEAKVTVDKLDYTFQQHRHAVSDHR